MPFNKVVLVILDSVGIGALPDAKAFGDAASVDTLGNIAKKKGGLHLHHLENMGLGAIHTIKGMKTITPKYGFAAKAGEKSKGKDTSTGHWEIAGLITSKSFPTFPKGFPKDMIERFIRENDLPGILCNKPASGTEIIAELGDESIRTGKPIVYTSGDSVFQIAAHEDHFGLDRLYAICESARKLCDEYRIARVIARPFLGRDSASYARTANRKDYSIYIPGKLLFDHLAEIGIPTHSIGKVSNIYNHQGIASNVPSKSNADGINKLIESIKTIDKGLILINLVDFDMLYGHRRDVNGYAQCLKDFDDRLPEIINALGPNDLLLLTADHGNDPTAKGTDHTREYVPVLAHSQRILEGKILPKRTTFADVGATIADALAGKKLPIGQSLLKFVKLEDYQNENDITAFGLIDKKKKGKKLSRQEIGWLIRSLMEGKIADYQMSAMLMAMFLKGLDVVETAHLTDAMLHSGKVLDFKDKRAIDKHSTGGVGDKTSFILAPIAAAAGVKVPMIAGRGLGHTGGTVDKIEAINGFRTDITMDEFQRYVMDNGIAMIGQTKDIAPADKIIYGLRDVTATIDHVSLITASIMSKKMAEGTSGLVIDIKCGNGAFMKTLADARKLEKSIRDTAVRGEKNISTMITDMNQPLGNACGNSIELIECVDVLLGKGPKDIADISFELAASMIHLAEITPTHAAAMKLVKKVIADGSAYEKFKELIRNQGGDVSQIDDLSKLPMAECRYEVCSTKAGFISGFDTEQVGLLVVDLGGGRRKASDKIDFGVGLMLHKKMGDKVAKGESLMTLYHNPNQLDLVKRLEQRITSSIITISSTKPKVSPLIMERHIEWS